MPLGEITVPWLRKGGSKAVLGGDGKWRSDDEALLSHLNAVWPMEGWWTSPSQGLPGAALLQTVADALGGKARILVKPSPPDPRRKD